MLIQRPEYLRFLQEWREKQVIKVVTGIRRCGKSTLFDLYRDFLKQDGVSEAEFLRGREQLKASSIYSQENTSAQMLLYGKEMLYNNAVYDFEKRMAGISALTRADVCAAIESGFDFSRAAVASVGNLEEEIRI